MAAGSGKTAGPHTIQARQAALNRAWSAGKIASDDAWRRVRPFGEVDAARMRHLKIDEAKRLINASTVDFRWLVQAALATGARYGELSALNVEDFNPDSGTLLPAVRDKNRRQGGVPWQT